MANLLVLTRKVKEAVIIDGKIKITVAAVDGDKVKLAIEAPKDIPVLRQELYEAVERENRESLHVSVDTSELPEINEFLPLENNEK